MSVNEFGIENCFVRVSEITIKQRALEAQGVEGNAWLDSPRSKCNPTNHFVRHDQKEHNAAVERPPEFLIFRRLADGRSAPTACSSNL